MDPVDRFHFPDLKPFAVPADFSEYIARLKEWFPHEAAAMDSYFAELRLACLYGLLYYFKRVPNEYAARLEHCTMAEKLDEHFRDPKLKALLLADTPHWDLCRTAPRISLTRCFGSRIFLEITILRAARRNSLTI